MHAIEAIRLRPARHCVNRRYGPSLAGIAAGVLSELGGARGGTKPLFTRLLLTLVHDLEYRETIERRCVEIPRL